MTCVRKKRQFVIRKIHILEYAKIWKFLFLEMKRRWIQSLLRILKSQ